MSMTEKEKVIKMLDSLLEHIKVDLAEDGLSDEGLRPLLVVYETDEKIGAKTNVESNEDILKLLSVLHDLNGKLLRAGLAS